MPSFTSGRLGILVCLAIPVSAALIVSACAAPVPKGGAERDYQLRRNEVGARSPRGSS